MTDDKCAHAARGKSPVRVLVADSDEETRCVLERLLNNCGYRVKTFCHLKDCIEEIHRDRPDLLLIHQSHLKDCSKELQESIVESSDSPIAVIVMSTDDSEMNEIEWPASCSVRAVPAPLHADQLLNAMCDLVGSGKLA